MAREELFVTTKIWPDNFRRRKLLREVDASLKALKRETIDLLLLHWPSKSVPIAETLDALAEVVAAGSRAVMLYIIQRGDCDRLALAEDIDPAYARALHRALAHGVEAYAYACALTRRTVAVDRRVPIAL